MVRAGVVEDNVSIGPQITDGGPLSSGSISQAWPYLHRRVCRRWPQVTLGAGTWPPGGVELKGSR